MPGYTAEALHKFQHPKPKRRQDAPHSWTKPTYGASVQYADDLDDSPALPAQSITLVQKIVGPLLYFAMVVDPTMLVALGTIARTQSKATTKTYDEVVWLLNYAHSNPNAVIRYCSSDMVLHIHSDGSYLSEPKSRSRAGGHCFLSDCLASPNKPPISTPTPNGPIYSVSRIIKSIMSATRTTMLPLNNTLPPLSFTARRVHVFPAIAKHPLLAFGQFCDDGYSATFTATSITLSKNGVDHIIGHHDPVNRLRHMDLSSPATLPPTIVCPTTSPV